MSPANHAFANPMLANRDW